MTFSASRWKSKKQTIVTKHKGFVRMALHHGASLVPLYSFGEMDILDNMPCPRWLQLWFIKTFRANAWMFPFGWKGLWGVPRPTQVDVVVGSKLTVPLTPEPTARQVEVLHRRYFTSLREIFERHKGRYGCEDHELVFEPPLQPLAAYDFAAAWSEACEDRELEHVSGADGRADGVHKGPAPQLVSHASAAGGQEGGRGAAKAGSRGKAWAVSDEDMMFLGAGILFGGILVAAIVSSLCEHNTFGQIADSVSAAAARFYELWRI